MTATPWLNDPDVQLYHGDVRAKLLELEPGTARMCVTSPPYYGLRDYGEGAQIGLEDSPAEYVANLVDVFRAVRRLLTDDGTLWLNLGDSYAAKARGSDAGWDKSRLSNPGYNQKAQAASLRKSGERHRGAGAGIKHKDLIGIPWMVAFALRADGWYLRRDIIWSKPNGMPESVLDRCATSHEYLFHLSKSERYFYDNDAIREPYAYPDEKAYRGGLRAGTDANIERGVPGGHVRTDRPSAPNPLGRTKRSVWTVPTRPYAGAHFATFPPDLITPCILAGSAPDDVVLDPFMGSGTTAAVARHHGRRAIGVELNEEYLRLAADRLGQQSIYTLSEGA